MKKTVFILITLLFMASSVPGEEMTGEQIINKVNDLFKVDTTYGKTRMTITTTSGKKRTFLFESWGKDDGEKTLIRYLEPRRVKGHATLMLNNADDIWMFFPRTQRVRKLATHAKKQRMQGSDFSYEDMGGGDSFITDFTSKRLKDDKVDGKASYTVELTRKPGSTLSYSRLVMKILKDNYVPVLIDYYDEKDPSLLLKTLKQMDIVMIDNLPTARRAEMIDRIRNSMTVTEMVEIKYNIPISDNMFTERNLKK